MLSKIIGALLLTLIPVAGWPESGLRFRFGRQFSSSSPLLMQRGDRIQDDSNSGDDNRYSLAPPVFNVAVARRADYVRTVQDQLPYNPSRRYALAGFFASWFLNVLPMTHDLRPALAASVSAEAQDTLRRGFNAAAEGLDDKAEILLTESIVEWQKTRQPPDEVAALFKTRGVVRQRQGKELDALSDFSESLRLVQLPDSKPDPAEIQRTYVLRANLNEKLQHWRDAADDFSSAISRLDDLDAIEATNPYLFSARGRVRSRVGDFSGAAEDFVRAEFDFKITGDKIRQITSAADAAIALYGTEQAPAVEKMRFVFKNKGVPASNNPDDIPLLQELSRKDAELHLAYAAHLLVNGRQTDAETQWESGCIRLEAYVQDGLDRIEEEKMLQAADAQALEQTGRLEKQRASSTANQPLYFNDFNARFNGLDPQSPYLTQRPQSNYFWYKTSQDDGFVERRDPGNSLAVIDPRLSCAKFRSSGWLDQNRPEWPPNLRTAVKQFAESVSQKPIVMPPKGSPPSKGELVY